jgi:LDH2 family malate/lactate/ureidoglycolate dehydrogenase
MKERSIQHEALFSYTRKVLEKLGHPKDQAEVTAWTLVEAVAHRIPSHGAGRLPFYQSNIKSRFVFPDAKLEVVHEIPSSLAVDGHNGVGPYLAKFTINRVIEKAKSAEGFERFLTPAISERKRSGRKWRWRKVSSACRQHPHSYRRCFRKGSHLSTNQACFAIPPSGKTPFILDMTATTSAHGKFEVCERRNK